MTLRRRRHGTGRQVRRRAGFLCEYCHTDERWQYVPFTVDHVRPLRLGGTDDLDNLALACFQCNRRKSDLLSAPDPETSTSVPLFNPRLQSWSEHFAWSSDMTQIVGLSAAGRATITTLDMNRRRIRDIRAADAAVGRHPPPGDPVLRHG